MDNFYFFCRMRTLERQQNNELDKKMKKTEKNIEAVIRMQKNRLLIMLYNISRTLKITLIYIIILLGF